MSSERDARIADIRRHIDLPDPKDIAYLLNQLASAEAKLAAQDAEIAFWQTCANCGEKMEVPGHCSNAAREELAGLESNFAEALNMRDAANKRAETAEAKLAEQDAEIAELMDALTALVEDRPTAKGEFVHFVACSASRRQPVGNDGCSCPIGRRIRASANALAQAHARIRATEWIPAVLSEYEVGRTIWAAEIVARSEKPIAEVGTRAIGDSLDALENDLRECLKLVGDSDSVRYWTRRVGDARVRYGFYRESWVLEALDFLDRTELASGDRAWISGLLFGYRADAIQQFIDRLAPST